MSKSKDALVALGVPERHAKDLAWYYGSRRPGARAKRILRALSLCGSWERIASFCSDAFNLQGEVARLGETHGAYADHRERIRPPGHVRGPELVAWLQPPADHFARWLRALPKSDPKLWARLASVVMTNVADALRRYVVSADTGLDPGWPHEEVPFLDALHSVEVTTRELEAAGAQRSTLRRLTQAGKLKAGGRGRYVLPAWRRVSDGHGNVMATEQAPLRKRFGPKPSDLLVSKLLSVFPATVFERDRDLKDKLWTARRLLEGLRIPVVRNIRGAFVIPGDWLGSSEGSARMKPVLQKLADASKKQTRKKSTSG